jgi:hypothetical protein
MRKHLRSGYLLGDTRHDGTAGGLAMNNKVWRLQMLLDAANGAGLLRCSDSCCDVVLSVCCVAAEHLWGCLAVTAYL